MKEHQTLPRDRQGVERLWIKIKGQAKMGDTIVGVYYRPPDSDKEVDEALCGQLEVALRPWPSSENSTTLIFVGGTTWLSTQSRKFLQILEDNLLMQVVGEPMRAGVLPCRGPFPLQ